MSHPNTTELPVKLPIHIRAFSEAAKLDAVAGPTERRERRTQAVPSGVSLIFDCETTTDSRQRLRFGFYQLRTAGELDEEGSFYDELSPEEVCLLELYSSQRGLLKPRRIDEFRSEVFLKRGYDLGAMIIGFNLPFDISRIALDADAARATRFRRTMKGGFSFSFSDMNWHPHVQVKHLNAKASVMEFTVPGEPKTSRSRRKRAEKTPPDRGHFCDVRTLAAALTSRSHSLESLTKLLKVGTQKASTEPHGERLTETYIDYARTDVQATWECFVSLKERYESYGLSAPFWKILSEASIGKAVLKEMGVKTWREAQPSPDPRLTGRIMSSYYGGRTEVRWRLTPKKVCHTDFMSMYPTVCTLMGLWRFMIADGFETRDATCEVRSMLANVTASEFQDPEKWPSPIALVRLRPGHDLLPVRAPYKPNDQATIGLNFLTSQEGLWYTLADIVAAKFLSGKTPDIDEAIAFEPGPLQRGLNNTSLLGQRAISPYEDDLFRCLIQLRQKEAALKKATTSSAEKQAREEVRQSLKIITNSSSYGIYVQRNVESHSRPQDVVIYGPDGEPFPTRSKRVETSGPNFHPLLATLITGAARLMLALAENQAATADLDWAFCDTDSLAICQPDQMPDAEFHRRTQDVVAWFAPLNPYGFSGSILQIEEVNSDSDKPGVAVPLYCLAISSKRYVLYNLDSDGRPIIRKASAHGLGHLLPPYGDDDPAQGVPEPLASLMSGKERLRRWEYDLWYKIIEATLTRRLRGLKYDYHPALLRPAVSRYAATSAELHRWFKPYNAGRPYEQRVKPFGFLYALHPKEGSSSYSDFEALTGAIVTRRIKPVAPFDGDLAAAIAMAFDRDTGQPVHIDQLQTYCDALDEYHLRAESKFLNGGSLQTGRTERRHVIAAEIQLIGKEADALEEIYFLGLREDPTIAYGRSPKQERELYTAIRKAAAKHGVKPVADAIGLTRSAVSRLAVGENVHTKVPHYKIARGLDNLEQARGARTAKRERSLEELRAGVCEHGGVRAAARHLGIDHSNLAARLRAGR